MLTDSQKRRNIGKLLSQETVGAWVVAYSISGNLNRRDVKPMQFQRQWYVPGGKAAVGVLELTNLTPTRVGIPQGIKWLDEMGREYTLPTVEVLPPLGKKYTQAVASEMGYRDYAGTVTIKEWPAGGSIDEDDSVCVVGGVVVQPQGEAVDEGEESTCNLVRAVLNVKDGALPGSPALEVTQKEALEWTFQSGESLAGFRVFTEPLSGYLYHQVSISPRLQFWQDQYIRIPKGSIVIRFEGVRLEEVENA